MQRILDIERKNQMKLTILGGGLSAITLAYFLQDNEQIEEITILEKEDAIGGLCRSIKKDGYTYDIGPHILFSKDKEMLELMIDVVSKTNKLRRSNQIIHKGRYVQYPFENDLSKLPKEDLEYCITAFQNNPYENYAAQNMLQFFLKTFGEGITNLYLRPYNEKIWKHDPSFMDTQMVERIPKPTNEEILRSAAGETVDGYVHQLYFDFPETGGIEAVVKGFADRLKYKCRILLNQEIQDIYRDGDVFFVKTEDAVYQSDKLVSTIPVQELTCRYRGAAGCAGEKGGTGKAVEAEAAVGTYVKDLKYNSIIIAFVKTKENLSGANFAFMIADKQVLFHRISKMDFLGEQYKTDGASYMVEVTFRQGDWIDNLPQPELEKKILTGLKEIGFVEKEEDAGFVNITKHKYAYVIYDLNHKSNMDKIREYYGGEGIYLHGRFGNFEYWNMDRILRESKTLAEKILGGGDGL